MNNKTLFIFFTLFFTQVGTGNTINSEILKKKFHLIMKLVHLINQLSNWIVLYILKT